MQKQVTLSFENACCATNSNSQDSQCAVRCAFCIYTVKPIPSFAALHSNSDSDSVVTIDNCQQHIGIYFVVVYNFTRFRCAENHTP